MPRTLRTFDTSRRIIAAGTVLKFDADGFAYDVPDDVARAALEHRCIREVPSPDLQAPATNDGAPVATPPRPTTIGEAHAAAEEEVPGWSKKPLQPATSPEDNRGEPARKTRQK